jgi:hypothetical protein
MKNSKNEKRQFWPKGVAMKEKDSHKGLKELQSNYKKQQAIATSWNLKRSFVGFQKQQLKSIETR